MPMLMMMLVFMGVVVMVMAATVTVVVVVMMLVFDLSHQIFRQSVATLHGSDDLAASKLIPGGGEDGRLGIFFPKEVDSAVQLGGVQLLGPGQDDGGGVFYLVVEELAKVLHIHLGLGGIYHSDEAVEVEAGGLLLHPLHGSDHVRQLSHPRGLDHDAVRGIIGQHLLQSGAEIAYQGAADTAGVHLRDLHTGVFQKATVDPDLTELIFDEDDLLALKGLIQQLLNERGLTSAQKPGDNIDLCHNSHILSQRNIDGLGPSVWGPKEGYSGNAGQSQSSPMPSII